MADQVRQHLHHLRMMIAEHDDGYILVTVTAPSDDSSIDVTSPEFSAILASVETK